MNTANDSQGSKAITFDQEQRLIQLWYADDGTVVGRIGPKYGYFLNHKKCKFTTTPQYQNLVRIVLRNTLFAESMVGVGTEILGAFVGDKDGKRVFVDDKVVVWRWLLNRSLK